VIMPQKSIELFQIDLVRFCHWKLNLVQNSIECNELIDVDNLNDIFIKDSFLFSLLSDFSDQHFSLNFLLTHDIDASEEFNEPIVSFLIANPFWNDRLALDPTAKFTGFGQVLLAVLKVSRFSVWQ
jgi:hypothetical protein